MQTGKLAFFHTSQGYGGLRCATGRIEAGLRGMYKPAPLPVGSWLLEENPNPPRTDFHNQSRSVGNSGYGIVIGPILSKWREKVKKAASGSEEPGLF